jgi:hypothetical protein
MGYFLEGLSAPEAEIHVQARGIPMLQNQAWVEITGSK